MPAAIAAGRENVLPAPVLAIAQHAMGQVLERVQKNLAKFVKAQAHAKLVTGMENAIYAKAQELNAGGEI
jgi:hypothetical protein